MQKPKKEIEKPVHPKTYRHRKPESMPSLWCITKTIQKCTTGKEGTARQKSAQCNLSVCKLPTSTVHDQIQILESTLKDYLNPLDYPITLNELQDKIKTLQPKKACGVGILNEMIKYTDNKFQLAILKLFDI